MRLYRYRMVPKMGQIRQRKRIIICTLPSDHLLQDCFFFWRRSVPVDHVNSDRKNMTCFIFFEKLRPKKFTYYILVGERKTLVLQ